MYFIYVHKESIPSPASMFTKLKDFQQHYVQIACTESHQNRTINVECADRNSVTPQTMTFNAQTSTEIAASLIFCEQILYQI